MEQEGVGLYTRIGGIGGSSILELFKYPLRFEISLVLLSLSASVFSPPPRSLQIPLPHLRTRMYSLLDCGLCFKTFDIK